MTSLRALRRALLMMLALALLWVAAQLVRSLSSFWVVFWLLMLWGFATGQ